MAKHKNLRGCLRAAVVVVAAFGFAGSASAQQLAWGKFKDNGCIGESGQRVYTSVLWNIPAGKDWLTTCMQTAGRVTLRDGKQVDFPQPTTCTKSTMNEALGVAALVVGLPGLVYKPAGAVSLVLDAGSLAMEKAGVGAINVWGIFQMVDPSCPGEHAKGYVQTIRVTTPGRLSSLLEQSFEPGTLGGKGRTRVCFVNYGDRRRAVKHDGPAVGAFNKIGTLGGSQCGSFPASARVTFELLDDGLPALTKKPVTMALGRYEGGTVTFAWKD
jgi:hypothetical protein